MDEKKLYLFGDCEGFCIEKDELYPEPFVKILRGPDNWMFVETWEVCGGGQVGISYSKELAELVSLDSIRRRAEERHKCTLYRLQRVTYPDAMFDEIYQKCLDNDGYLLRGKDYEMNF